MSTSTLGLFLRHLAISEEVSRLGTTSDHDLLVACEEAHGQAAFTELMRRHGPMVLRTCRRVLGHGPDAEDAFQATFVLLSRKVSQLRREARGPLSLGGWLHHVAYQTAQKVLRGMVCRRTHEQQVKALTHPDRDPSAEATWNEIRPILDAELDALPDEARRLLIACYFQEKTYREVEEEFGLPRSSVARHLERARGLLARRLARRGITVSSVLLAILLEDAAKGVGVSAVLLVHTVEAARSFTEHATGIVSDNVVRLVKGGLANMTKGWTHWSMALAGWLSLLGVGLIACQTLKAWPDQPPESEPSAAAERPAQEKDNPGRTDRYGDLLPPGALARLGTERLRHTTSALWMAFTRDGKGLITAGPRFPTRLWDVANGRMVRQFGDSGDNYVRAGALSPDGRTLAGCTQPREGAGGGLGLWDVATGTLLRRLKMEDGDRLDGLVIAAAAARLTFSPDGKTVAAWASVRNDSPKPHFQTLRLWEVATGKELWRTDRLEVVAVSALTFSADGKTLIWGGSQGQLRFLDAATGGEVRRWDDDKKRFLRALACSPDGRLFAAYDQEGNGSLTRLWDAATGQEVWQRVDEDRKYLIAAAFSPDGKVLATGSSRGPLCLWDAATGKELHRCAGCPRAFSLAFAPDGKTLAAGQQAVHLWDVGSGRQVGRTLVGHEGTVGSVAFTPDGQDIISGSWDGSLRVWDAATGEQRRQVVPPSAGQIAYTTSAVSPDGKTFPSVTWDEIGLEPTSLKFRLWDRETGRELRGWSGKLGNWRERSLVFSSDGKKAACTLRRTGGARDEVHLWETTTGKEFSPIAAGGYPAFSPDGKLLATVSDQDKQSFTLREAATGKELCSVKVPGRFVHGLLFSPDGRMLATASNSTRPGNQQNVVQIHLWPLLREESANRQRQLPGAVPDPAADAAGSPVRVGPPRALASVISSRWLSVWSFSPDSRTLAMALEDGGPVRLLETATGKERGRFVGHGYNVTALSFSPDGRRLASGSHDTTVLVWDVTGRLQDGRLRPVPLSDKEIEKLWADLATDDAGRARRAIWTLAASPNQAVPYLVERLRTSAAEAKTLLGKLPQLFRDLDDDAFAIREKAKVKLAGLGAAAEPALRQALAQSPSVERRRSLEQLLKAIEAERQVPSRESLRGMRALEVLEHIGTREARAAIQTLTADAPAESSLTQEAHAALERLDRAERR